MVGIVDEQGLTNPGAHVVLKEGFTPSPGLSLDLQEFVRGNTAPHHYSCWIEFIDELPKTATGKIRRFKLREMSGGRPAASQPAPAPAQPIIRPATGSEEAPSTVAGSGPGGPIDSIPAAAGPVATGIVTEFVAELRDLDDAREQRDRLGAYMQSQLAVVLGLDDGSTINLETEFLDLGMDSMAAVAFTNRLQTGLGCPLAATLLVQVFLGNRPHQLYCR